MDLYAKLNRLILAKDESKQMNLHMAPIVC